MRRIVLTYLTPTARMGMVDGDGDRPSVEPRLSKTLALLLWASLAATVMMVLVSPPAQAETYTVNTAQDTAAVTDGACTTDFRGCSLRDAITAANASAGVADTINFGLNQIDLITITTSSPLPTITGSAFAGLTIDGSEANYLTISGANQHRVFRISSPARVTLKSLTVANGNAAGGNGGGIYNDGGNLTVTNSTITGNSASEGGGIYSEGLESVLQVTNSAITGNPASTSGGGIYSEGALKVSNSTISGNSANMGGGIFYDEGTTAGANIFSTTIYDNSVDPDGEGSAIFNGDDVTMGNTIVANNPGSDNCIAPVTDGGNNLDSGTSCGFIPPVSLSNSDPRLGPLQDNGGLTETHALLAGSPAINKGDNDLALDPGLDPLRFDQRGAGYARIVGGIVDIGAFEVQGLGSEPPPPEVPEDKQACKKGGYKGFGFRNQGLCIKAVNHPS